MICIKGSLSRIIFEGDNGYKIGIFKIVEADSELIKNYVGRTISFTGYFHELNTMDNYLLYGELINHPKYGEQFQVDHYDRCIPEEKDSIVEFLTSGLFKGIGEKKAKAIVDVLGKDTLKIILEQPNNLILIPGISQANISTLHTKLLEYEESYEVILYLTELGFSTKDSMMIYSFYKKKSKEVLEKDIYQVVEDIQDLYFKKVDMIALHNGVEVDAKIRVKAAFLYIMREISNTYGHCYYSFDELALFLPRVIGKILSDEEMISSLEELEKDSKVVHKEDKYYLKDMYDAECLIVKRFRLLNSNKENTDKRIDSVIKDLEEFFNITYNPQQLEAIKKSYVRDFLVITGGPGTGKTTILKGILELYRQLKKYSYEELHNKVALLAPTGRAAKRMSEATMFPASTIHRFLKWQKEQNRFQVNEYNKSKVEFVILDEASMVDTYLMANLLKGISSNCRIVLIGDDHQLPSVGPGQVLHDVIECKKLEVVELTELYRQGKDSNIITLAYDIRNQYIQRDIFNVEEDLTFIECNDTEVLPNICDICTTYQDYNYKDFQILAPMYKGLVGIDKINEKVQMIFNPKDDYKKEMRIGDALFREDDKVIQLTNMPDDNVYNGDIGLIEEIQSGTKKEIKIDFDGNEVRYTSSNFNNFRQAYAISIHKAQGSEFDVVVIPIIKGYHKMLYQKLIYTAVTRAKKKLYLVGDIKALEMASSNVVDDIRKTSILDYFVNGIK